MRRRRWEEVSGDAPLSPFAQTLLIPNWPAAPKTHAQVTCESGLLEHLTLLSAQAANISGILHCRIPKRDGAPRAARTGLEALAAP